MSKLLAPPILASLKPFQVATVEHVFFRLFGPDPVRRFLVADEVGLGKTLVARGVIAKTADHLRALGRDRIDIVYICSNADIAAQNVRRLRLADDTAGELPPRLVLLPTHFHQLRHGRTRDGEVPVNLLSFTPGTSFALGEQFGRKDERMLLWWMLRHAWGPDVMEQPGAFRILIGGARPDTFEDHTRHYGYREVGDGPGRIDRGIADQFALDLELTADPSGGPIRARFDALADYLRSKEQGGEWRECARLVGDLRSQLARTCIAAMQPSLVILDEFQRFRSLLTLPDGADSGRKLAHELFMGLGNGEDTRTLLLSATPYKMFTLSDESDTDDHYADFSKTMEFLLGTPAARDLAFEFSAYREALLDPGQLSLNTLHDRAHAIEGRLQRVMARTERPADDAAGPGMLDKREPTVMAVSGPDVRAYLTLDVISRQVRASGDPVEYWKSTPYALSFMETYDVRRRLKAESASLRPPAVAALQAGHGLLRANELREYRAIEYGNPRLRSLAAEILDGDAWRLLWIPASLPYYRPERWFASKTAKHLTKRLIFSAWTAVPQAIASVLSYEAERRMLATRFQPGELSSDDRQSRSLLSFRMDGVRPGSMTSLLLVYPSIALAEFGDPLRHRGLASGEARVLTARQVLDSAERAIRSALEDVRPAAEDPAGRPDDRWYWLAPLLLDRAMAPEAQKAFLGRQPRTVAESFVDGQPRDKDPDEARNLSAHLGHAWSSLQDPSILGARPKDLARVLASVAVGGPAVCALRALWRPLSESERLDPRVLGGAARVAWGFRSLYRLPEVSAMLRGRSQQDRGYWKRVATYGVDGCLQAVLDEYAHVLPDFLGRIPGTDRPIDRAEAIARGMYEALTLRTARYGFDDIRSDGTAVVTGTGRIRARFALRFGADVTDEEGQVQRATQVRDAFNSPFWPFVLATTSVGQEGLDFHLYCHAVVHWNLPANPVDLEQREGRVHRYKGHAVRRNIADAFGSKGFGDQGDPWATMFEAARHSAREGVSDGLVPYWTFTGRHQIERHVPVLPFSREIERYGRLRKARAIYRLVIGLAGQEDLLAFVQDHLLRGGHEVSTEDLQRRLAALRIDLRPPSTCGGALANHQDQNDRGRDQPSDSPLGSSIPADSVRPSDT